MQFICRFYPIKRFIVSPMDPNVEQVLASFRQNWLNEVQTSQNNRNPDDDALGLYKQASELERFWV